MMDALGCGRRPLRNSAIAAMVLAGCATAQNTPLQDYVWEMGRNCNAAGITMTKVDPDGRYHLTGANVTSFSAFTDCMQEQQQKHPYQEWLTASKKQASPAPSAPSAPALSAPAGGSAPR